MAAPSPIRLVREAAGLSMAAMADALSLTRQRVGQLETGSSIPASVAIRLASKFQAECEALGLTVETLVRYRRTSTGRALKPRAAVAPAEGGA